SLTHRGLPPFPTRRSSDLGRTVAAEAALALTESRAKRAAAAEAEGGAPWPELAEYNCFACHQSLRPEVGALADAGRRGVPRWQRSEEHTSELQSRFDLVCR